jgi:hypothetical protein
MGRQALPQQPMASSPLENPKNAAWGHAAYRISFNIQAGVGMVPSPPGFS